MRSTERLKREPSKITHRNRPQALEASGQRAWTDAKVRLHREAQRPNLRKSRWSGLRLVLEFGLLAGLLLQGSRVGVLRAQRGEERNRHRATELRLATIQDLLDLTSRELEEREKLLIAKNQELHQALTTPAPSREIKVKQTTRKASRVLPPARISVGGCRSDDPLCGL